MGKYDGWDRYFRSLEGDEQVLTFAELEALIEGELPRSAYTHEPWWSNVQHQAKWARHGWFAHPDLRRRTVRFDRRPTGRGRPPASSAPGDSRPLSRQPGSVEHRLVLLGCVSEKQSVAAPARDMYTSPLWEKRRGYAEATGQPWAILSAEYGLLMPDQVVEPYDRALKKESVDYRRSWSERVAAAVIGLCRDQGLRTVEAHAGAAYLENGLIARLNAAGIKVLWPLRGMKIGEQLSWYGTQGAGPPTNPSEPPSQPPRAAPTGGLFEPRRRAQSVTALVPVLIEAHRIPPFTFRWPDSEETFEYGWEGTVEAAGRRIQFWHGVGGREVYGAERVHTVSRLGGTIVEGVACDDYDRSRSLLSRIKLSDGRMARSSDEVHGLYGSLAVVDHRSEIDAPYSPAGMAVKLRVDDLAGWVLHAWLRSGGSPGAGQRVVEQPGGSGPEQVSEVEEVSPDFEDAPEALEQMSAEHKQGVAAALAGFADRARELAGDLDGASFAHDEDANQLLAGDPFAFLLAVIADYQIPAERAWGLPYLLKQRLGHLDIERIAVELGAVSEAVARRPSLHRYVNRVPEFFAAAAQIVLNQYDGDVSRIWAGNPTAVDVQERLRRFPGISQKKAAMAVEILERDFGVPIREMHGSDIAYDVHIRRVFLRSGLGESDDQQHMIEAARLHWPERPGLLDLPSWVIGRNWCRPRDPDCAGCPINQACARRISAADGVRGA